MNSQPELKLLPVSELVTENIRYDYGDLQALAATFVDGQPDAPPVVHPNERGYIVEEGNRRVEAARQIGTTHLWCVVKPTAPDNLKIRQLIADLQHKRLIPLEKAQALRDILDESPDLTQAQLAETLGRSETEISQALGLLDLAEPVQQALRQGHISEGIAELLIPLDVESQERVLPDILPLKGKRSNKPTVAQARRVISEATMTEEERRRLEDKVLARTLARVREEASQHQPDLCDRLLDNGEPTHAVHLLYWLVQATDNVEQAWQVHKLEGSSVDLRRRVNDVATRLIEVTEKIREVTK